MASLIHIDDGYQRKTILDRDMPRFDAYWWRYIIAKGNIIEGIEAKA